MLDRSTFSTNIVIWKMRKLLEDLEQVEASISMWIWKNVFQDWKIMEFHDSFSKTTFFPRFIRTVGLQYIFPLR
jgi:hypothetical protein